MVNIFPNAPGESSNMFCFNNQRGPSRVKPYPNGDNDVFTLTLNNNDGDRKKSDYEVVKASRPLIYFVSLFGMQTVRWCERDIYEAKFVMKMYSSFIILVLIALALFVRPISWRDTAGDPPLNILTKTYVRLQVVEVVYSIFTISIYSNGRYVKLFKKLSSVDEHYGIGAKVFFRRRIVIIFLIFIPVLQVTLSSWLRKFHVNNLMTQFTFSFLILQGIFCIYILLNMYLHLLILNTILFNKIETLAFGREFIFEDTFFNKSIKKIFLSNPDIISRRNYCWYEVMAIYDKISDCFSFFNEIYSEQILIMFNNWLLCTMLAICRAISPTIKYSQVYKSDILRFTSISARPLILIKFSEYFIQERRKTLMIILHIMAHGDLDVDYFGQVQTMTDLVNTKKSEISANIFTANIPLVLNFSGRAISYIVLMIQYFYMHEVNSN